MFGVLGWPYRDEPPYINGDRDNPLWNEWAARILAALQAQDHTITKGGLRDALVNSANGLTDRTAPRTTAGKDLLSKVVFDGGHIFGGTRDGWTTAILAIEAEAAAHPPATVPDEGLDRWAHHDDYCPAVGAKGTCTCGLQEALTAYRRRTGPDEGLPIDT